MDTTVLLIFVTSLGVGFSGALMPGPLLTITVSESVRRGFRVGPLLIAGHGIAELVLLVALALGLRPLLEIAQVKGGIAVLGGLVLVWMGYGIARAVWQGRLSLKLATAVDAPATNRHVITGALVSVSNPYWILWWATVGASYVAWAQTAGTLGLVSFYTGHILSDLTWYSLIAALVAGGGRLLNDAVYRGLLGVCGAFLVALGVYFVLSGLQFWLA
jgi:threonine/homoserine/homoserine lactone efflux protein